MVGKSPFSARPDTLESGDLLGPFDGTVCDAETERPIAGATVAGSWCFERGVGLVGPAGFREFAMETSADGRYRIPRPDDVPTGGSVRLRRFTLIVYRRGYVAYRSDFKFGSGEKRHDFSQRACKVRLDKWLPTMEHRRHLAFLGGGQAIAKAAAWEAQPASLEQEGRAVPPPAEKQAVSAAPAATRMLDASPLLSAAEVRGVTGFAGEFEVGRLSDLVRSDVYDSRHFKAKGQSEAFDVGVRVWSLGPRAAEAQFEKLKGELPAATPSDEVGDRAVRARGGDVAGLAFLLRDKGLVIQVSCGTAQCTDADMVLRLARLVESHVGELASPESEPPVEAGEEDGGQP
ncbi:MAG: hypothetical protein JXP73_20195 [Deltaproteobacteria bacterium]|nr:hypothetical protein [Deltaproteobacteria bacterium]